MCNSKSDEDNYKEKKSLKLNLMESNSRRIGNWNTFIRTKTKVPMFRIWSASKV